MLPVPWPYGCQSKAWAAGAAQMYSTCLQVQGLALTPVPLGRVEGLWTPKSR